MQYFYSRHIDNFICEFDSAESDHITKVLRKTHGETIRILDGKGSELEGVITNIGKQVTAHIERTIRQNASPEMFLTIAISPTKRMERMEWMVEKVTEIGVNKIIFIETEKGERLRINEGRLAKKGLSAMKQSGNLWLPHIQTGTKIKDFVKNDTSTIKYIAHCFDTDKTTNLERQSNEDSISVMIGPEGDFSKKEIELAENHGFIPLSLGIPRYRTETAAVVACTLLNHFNVTLAKNN